MYDLHMKVYRRVLRARSFGLTVNLTGQVVTRDGRVIGMVHQ